MSKLLQQVIIFLTGSTLSCLVIYLTFYSASINDHQATLIGKQRNLITHTESILTNIEKIRGELKSLQGSSHSFNHLFYEDGSKASAQKIQPEPPEPISSKDGTLIQDIYKNLSAIHSQLKITKKNIKVSSERATSIPAIMPGKGPINSLFGMRESPIDGKLKLHKGIDISVPDGTPIYATANGFVTEAKHRGPYGKMITLSHNFGFESRYAHLSKFLVKAGDKIERGQKIGLSGSTGRTTGAHLHYEILLNKNHINPLPFVNVRKQLNLAKTEFSKPSFDPREFGKDNIKINSDQGSISALPLNLKLTFGLGILFLVISIFVILHFNIKHLYYASWVKLLYPKRKDPSKENPVSYWQQ